MGTKEFVMDSLQIRSENVTVAYDQEFLTPIHHSVESITKAKRHLQVKT